MHLVPNRIITLFIMLLLYIWGRAKSYNNKDIWLIGEHRGFCLKDNGFFFYKFCRQKYPDKPVYLAVRRSSSYFNELTKNDENVVVFGSFKHIRLFFKATLYFYTHSYSDIIYRRYFEIFATNAKLIYLHHGVLGFKKFNTQYMKDKDLMDLFVVGNSLEKSILVKDIGINENKIKVTGYPRFDYLSDTSQEKNLQIIYIPTHRNWIKNEKQFKLFYKNIDAFLNNRKLENLLNENNAVLKVYMHYNMQKFSDSIKISFDRVKVIKYGKESPLKLICSSNIMITDYSSVSWDFFYLGKPIIFYRFDIDLYENDRGSYIPLDKPIIGDIALNSEDLIINLSNIIRNNYVTNNKYLKTRNQIFPSSIQNNCAKVYNESQRILRSA